MSKLYWNKERCLSVAKECKTRSEFYRKNASAYTSSLKHGWIEEYKWFEPPIKNVYKDKVDNIYVYIFPNNVAYVGRTIHIKVRHWEHKTLIHKDVVARYVYDNELSLPEPIILESGITIHEGLEREKYWADYYKSQGFKLLNSQPCGINHGSLGSLGKGKWTKERTFEEAKKCSSKSEFKKLSDSAYQAAIKHGWMKDYIWFKRPVSHRKVWDEEKCLEAAQKCSSIKEFRENFVTAYYSSRRNGWFQNYTWLNRAIKPNNYWCYETCYEEAKKYTTKQEFQKHCSQGYALASANKWFDEYTWFKEVHKPSNYWSKERCLDEARKYKTKSDFRKKSEIAYNKAACYGWLKEISEIVWGE